MNRSFSEAITLPTRKGKGMSYSEAMGYLREQIGSLDQQKNYVIRTKDIDVNERMKMVSTLSSKIYAIHVGISCIQKEIERQANGTTPTAV